MVGSHDRLALRRLLLVILIVYGAASLLALFAIPASVEGWVGVEPDPLSGIFALILALPWSLALLLFTDAGPWASFLICAAGIAINCAIIWRMARHRSAP
ncbi:hypothetical protein [Sphingomicrobium arenosum]|uniref:hypothetical protein n=1 Tax=Sphingomicrobium arenosum TaxID=2233861 RepID=UPI00223ED4F2|nr:hypothetical protein [Sphingomicrobium arenosum]